MDERPIKTAQLKIYGRLERSHIHYDRVIICEDGRQYESRSKCCDGYWGLYPSFRMSCPKTYLKGREHHGFYDSIDEEKLMRDIVDVCLPFQFKIESIKFYDIPFICPETGISWQYNRPDKKEYNSHYKWKKLPKNRKTFIVCQRECDHIKA
jgi:hypothetical protein